MSGEPAGREPGGETADGGRPQPGSDPSQPARVLAVDVGAGTADILLTRLGQPLENAVKLVVPSRTQTVAAQIAAATRRGLAVLFRGPTMGGGYDTVAMKAHLAAGLPFSATREAALSFADDLDRVRRLGVTVLDGDDDPLPQTPETVVVRSGDLEPDELRRALALLGVDPACDAVAVAVQDHGFNPHGSNRVLRFTLWEQAVRAELPLAELFCPAAAIPPSLTRMRAAADLAGRLTTGPVLAGDTGPAALYGALPPGVGDAVLVNVGNGHTICAVALGGRLAGVFEHHTSSLDGAGLEDRLRRFLAGDLRGDEVRADGGHGAVLAAGATDRDLPSLPMIVTGPRRDLLRASALRLEFAAPHGDMMLTGCFGLLRAVRDRYRVATGPAS